LDYHYGRHGDEVGATSRDQYKGRQKNLLKQLKKALQRAVLMELLKAQFDIKRMENILILRQTVLLYHLGSNKFGGDYRWD